MAERNGKVVSYNPTNRLGEIQPDGGGPNARFYLPAVSNAEPAPKRGDTVSFDAPEPRKNKKGKLVQGDASTVTILERAPEPPPGSENQSPRERRGRDARRGPGRRGSERGSRGPRENRGERGSRNDRRGGFKRDEVGSTGGAPGGRAPGDRSLRPRRERRPVVPRELKPGEKPQVGARGKRGKTREPKVQKPLAARVPIGKVPSDALTKWGIHPSLLLERFIGWPLGKPEHAEKFHLTPRNRNYFLRNIFLPQFHRHATRSSLARFHVGTRSRHLSKLKAQGYFIAQDVASAVDHVRFGGIVPTVLGSDEITLDWVSGEPFIPARVLRNVLKSASGTVDPKLWIFDAYPASRVYKLESQENPVGLLIPKGSRFRFIVASKDEAIARDGFAALKAALEQDLIGKFDFTPLPPKQHRKTEPSSEGVSVESIAEKENVPSETTAEVAEGSVQDQ